MGNASRRLCVAAAAAISYDTFNFVSGNRGGRCPEIAGTNHRFDGRKWQRGKHEPASFRRCSQCEKTSFFVNGEFPFRLLAERLEREPTEFPAGAQQVVEIEVRRFRRQPLPLQALQFDAHLVAVVLACGNQHKEPLHVRSQLGNRTIVGQQAWHFSKQLLHRSKRHSPYARTTLMEFHCFSPRSFVRVRIARGRSSLIKLLLQHTHKYDGCTTGTCTTKLTPKRELAELTSQSVQAGFFQPSCLRISMSCGRVMALTSHPFSLQYFSENAARFCISKSWSSLAPKMLCSRSPSLITDIFSSWLYLLSFPRGARLLHFYERSTLIDSVELCFAAIYRDAAA